MKTLAAIILFAATLSAGAQYTNTITGELASVLPNPLWLGGWKSPPSAADYDAAGWAALTAEQIAAAAQAAAEAAAQAAEIEALPRTFDTGIAVKDDAGHYVELVPEGQDVVAVQISNSPLDPATRRAMKQAAVASERQRRQGWRAANLAMRSSLTNNIADVEAIRDGLTATSTTAQVRSALIATVRELRQAQGDLQELRRLLANHVREDQ